MALMVVMSGSSFDYLYGKDPLRDYSQVALNLQFMIEAMEEEGYKEPARLLRYYREKLVKAHRELHNEHNHLVTLMHEYEWYTNGDLSKEQLDNCLEEVYRIER